MQLTLTRFAAALLLAASLLASGPAAGQERAGHGIRFADSESMYDFFSWTDGAPVIVQGHREPAKTDFRRARWPPSNTCWSRCPPFSRSIPG